MQLVNYLISNYVIEMNVACIFPITNNYDKPNEIMEAFKTKIAPTLEKLGVNSTSIHMPGT